MVRALLVVDVQNDFCEGGSLAVHGGSAVAAAITDYLREGPAYDHVVATRDHHVDPGAHFASDPDFVDTWPAHCVAGTRGAQFHPALDQSRIEAVFDKGERAAAYSGFEGFEPSGTSLAHWLKARAVTDVDIVGIATDHCVRATAIDARQEGLAVRVQLGLTAGVLRTTTEAAIELMREAGVVLEGAPLEA